MIIGQETGESIINGPILGRVCNDCRKKKGLNDFYTKGERLESICKGCSKRKRKNRYRKNKRRLKRLKNRNISRVVMTKNSKLDREKFRRDMVTIESILSNLLVKMLIQEKEKKNAS